MCKPLDVNGVFRKLAFRVELIATLITSESFTETFFLAPVTFKYFVIARKLVLMLVHIPSLGKKSALFMELLVAIDTSVSFTITFLITPVAFIYFGVVLTFELMLVPIIVFANNSWT